MTEEVQLPRGIGINLRSLEEMELQLQFLEKLRDFWFCSDHSARIDEAIVNTKRVVDYISSRLFPTEMRGDGQ